MGKTYVLSLGGSVFIPDQVDGGFIKDFKALIEKRIQQGDTFIIITGGGKVCRRYQAAARDVREMQPVELDWIGIHVTRMNAEFVRILFGDLAHPQIIGDPEVYVETDKPVLIGAGWEPGWSTDYDTVMVAKTFDADVALNLSNIAKVYTKDPNQYEDAQPIDEITWEGFREIVGHEFRSGGNYPFDPVASKVAQEIGLEVVCMAGKDLENLEQYFDGKEFVGTVIRG
jgi:uridylate kinase